VITDPAYSNDSSVRPPRTPAKIGRSKCCGSSRATAAATSLWPRIARATSDLVFDLGGRHLPTSRCWRWRWRFEMLSPARHHLGAMTRQGDSSITWCTPSDTSIDTAPGQQALQRLTRQREGKSNSQRHQSEINLPSYATRKAPSISNLTLTAAQAFEGNCSK